MMCDHLGHDIMIHRNIYRSQSYLLEKTKIACLLKALESGTINKFAGKRIEDIPIEGT